MNRLNPFRIASRIMVTAMVLICVGQSVFAQQGAPVVARLPAPVEQALADTNRATSAMIDAIDRRWRGIFRQSRSQNRLRGFVDDAIDIIERFQQVHDAMTKPGGSDARIRDLFRRLIMNEEMVCKYLDEELVEFSKYLDSQDQSLWIKLRLDKEASQTRISRSVLDPGKFKKPINDAATAVVIAVQNDMARWVASWIATEALGMGARQLAQDFGITSGDGTLMDFFTGFAIELGINAAVEAVTDPKPQMISDLEKRLQEAERGILDGSQASPGFVTTLRRIAVQRAEARRKLLITEFLN